MKFISSILLVTALFHGAVSSSSNVQDETKNVASEKKSSKFNMDKAKNLKALVSQFKNGGGSFSPKGKNFHDLVSLIKNQSSSPLETKGRMLQGAPTCPLFLKNAKKTEFVALCAVDDGEESVLPMICDLASYETKEPVAFFSGTVSSSFLFPSISGHLIYPTGGIGPSMEDQVRKGNVPNLIVTPMNGILPSLGGRMEDGEAEPVLSFPVPLGVPYTSPYGQNLCGANKFKYLSFTRFFDEEFMGEGEVDIAYRVKFN